MKQYFWLLCALLTGQGRATAQPAAQALPVSAAPVVAYTSGDRLRNGAHDTLHVGRGTVLYLKPGNKHDFDGFRGIEPFKPEASYLQLEKPNEVRRSGNELRLQPKQGLLLRLVNDTYQTRGDENEARDVRYEFIGSIAGKGYWLVVKTGREVITYLVVSKLNGRVARVWGPPVVAPNGQYALAQSLGIETGMAPNGLELVALTPQRAQLKWTRILRHWEPYRLRWLNDKTVAIEQQRFIANGESKLTYVRLSLASLPVKTSVYAKPN